MDTSAESGTPPDHVHESSVVTIPLTSVDLRNFTPAYAASKVRRRQDHSLYLNEESEAMCETPRRRRWIAMDPIDWDIEDVEEWLRDNTFSSSDIELFKGIFL